MSWTRHVLTLLILLLNSSIVNATDAYPKTNDQSTTIAVPRWWYNGQTADQITTLINANNARITHIRVEDPTVPTFAVTMVQNTGDYSSTWWWYVGQTADQVTTNLDGRRLISIDPYMTSSGLQFAVVMVPNTGDQDRAWWWYYDVDEDSVNSLLTQNNARPVEVRPYDNGGRKYAVIMISNTNADEKNWEWRVGVTPDQITARIQTGLRLTSLAPDPTNSGIFVAILIENDGEAWWWYYGLDPTTAGANLGTHNSRFIDLSSYVVNGVRQYAVVELDDGNPPQAPINTESTTVRAQAESNGWAGGYHGSYFAESSASPSPLVADNPDFRYEPASAIKVLYLLYTLQQNVDLTSMITYYWTDGNNPSPDVCPLDAVPEVPANEHQTTIQNALNHMMQESNNVFTRAFALKWGLPAVQSLATSLGMSSTHLNQQWIGCGFRNGIRNELTLSDVTKLYSSVDRGVALSEPQRTTFFNILVGGSPVATDAFGSIVTQEASKVGKSANVTQFLNNLNVRWKAGSYTFCLSTSCDVHKVDLGVGGWMSVPYGSDSNKTFVFGDFVNDLFIPCAPTGSCTELTNAYNEILGNVAEAARPVFNEALAAW